MDLGSAFCRFPLIDHFITNSKANLTKWGTITTSISDHYLIYAVRKVGIPRGSPRFIETRNVLKIILKLNLLMTSTTQYGPSPNNEDNINIVWEEWKLKMLSILDKHAPWQTKRICNKPSPWIIKILN
jgi:hypothetical protein